jgi:hypothetical protein
MIKSESKCLALKYSLRKSSEDKNQQKPTKQGKIHIFHTIFLSAALA